jgi:hypothetical protein
MMQQADQVAMQQMAASGGEALIQGAAQELGNQPE